MNNGDRICQLTSHFRRHRIDWRKAKGVMAKELQGLMAETIQINKEHLMGEPSSCPLTKSNQERLSENLIREST